MFNSEQAKGLGHAVRRHAPFFLPALAGAFERSILGEHDEVRFFDKLLAEIPVVLQQNPLPNLHLGVRVAKTHKKPIVVVSGTNGFSCELADLLVVVKYDLGGGLTERKSLLYQVKLCETGTTLCKIDQNQLTLLTTWPAFAFGLKATGGPVTYQVEPKTLEFGSYMLMLRAPGTPLFHPWGWYPWSYYCYGISPYAQEVRSSGPSQVDIAGFPRIAGAAEVFFSHLGFELGEHHDFNVGAAALVAALYRHLKLDPDPPDEFEGFTREVNQEREPGFAIVEVTVGPGKEYEWPPRLRS